MAQNKPRSFVFHDPSGKRWIRFRRIAKGVAIAAALFIALVILIIFTGPQLPVLGLPAVAPLAQFGEVPGIIRGQRTSINAPYRKPNRLPRNNAPLKYVRSASPVLHPRTAAQGLDGAPLVWGFYVNWDPNSMVSLRLHLRHLTHLVPEWFTLKDATGDIDDKTDPTVVAIAKQANLPIMALLTNYRDGWRPEIVSSILKSADRRADLIEAIRANLAEHQFAGVNIDFENLPAQDRAGLVIFMKELTADLHSHGFLVSEDVPVGDRAYDLEQLAAINDYLLPMIYDEHYQSGEPGPVASQGFFEDQITKLAKSLPASKLIAGFGNYGYDWIIGDRGGAEVVFDDVMAAASESGAAVEWDNDAENPVLRYSAEGRQHEVWFLDAVTALNQAMAARDAGFRGLGLWRLGAEDPGLWQVLGKEAWPQDHFPAGDLEKIEASQQAPRHYGRGEILKIRATPRGGARKITPPATDDDSFRELYTQYPTPWVVDHSGRNREKLLCLTFDDGPDPKYTPLVLDILKSKGVPATFFVIGANAEANPGLIRREYNEGHEIGNHTYSHPNAALISAERGLLELSTTQRIIENLLGVSTTLFRPPYNADSEPLTPQEIEPIRRAQDAGYTTVAERIDPRDWDAGATAEAIAREVEEDAESGNVILLHDAGGKREATLAALPQMIDRLRAKGYRFGTISDLVGKSRADVMPRPDAQELRLAQIEGQTLGTRDVVGQLLGMLFLAAIWLTVARSVVYGLLAILQKIRARHEVFAAGFNPPVSVVIAAFNEETVIVRAVESILSNGYPDVEVIVVDDGSKDRTLEILRERFGSVRSVQILSQVNSGKSEALNRAIAVARNNILIAVDADTLFREGTIGYLVRHFSNPRTGAVSGNARVGNRNNWITRFQSIEYIYGFNLDRRALDYINAITVVPGAVGAWRKDLVLAAGGFGNDTLAEDADLTLAIRRMGYAVRYEQEAIAYTEAPEDGASLAKQRFRWSFGTLQAAWKHRDALFVPKYGTLGFVALPGIWLFQVLLSSLSPFAEVAMVMALLAGNWKIVLLYYAAFFGFELFTGIAAYLLEGIPAWDLSLLFFQRIYYRQMMLYVLGRSLMFAVRGRLVGWGKLERKASVSQPA